MSNGAGIYRTQACSPGRVRGHRSPGCVPVNMILLFLLTWTQIQLGAGVSGQSTGQLRFRFEPERGMQYLLDGKYSMTDREVTLQEGSHRFVFWAPERRMLDTALFVIGGRMQDIQVTLRYSVEFIDHRRAQERYQRNARLGVIVPTSIAAVSGAWFAVSTVRMIKSASDLRELDGSYATLADPASIQRLKNDQLPAARADLRNARGQVYISGGLVLASVGTAFFLKHRNKQRTPPEFKDTERVRFEGLVWLPGSNGGTWATGLSLPIR